uniref:Butyrophilin subfamily 1 member A1-like n=1 Tax=Neovison vison TaxID=452646 RepID=A0A8C7A7A6_NEOVI
MKIILFIFCFLILLAFCFLDLLLLVFHKYLYFLTPMSVSTEQFMVLGPSEPIVAVLGADITLPCHVSPARDVENMELRWFRSKFSEAVFIYQNQREQREEQLAQYRGRTSLVKDFLTQGEAAVRIHNVQTFDNGLYTCFFRMGIFYEEASLELMVYWNLEPPQGLMSVNLDPESAHSNLAVSDDKTSVTFKNSYSGSNDGVYSVFGHEGITSGCCYWEVEIRNAEKSEWALGVCRRDVERKEWYQEGPEKGFWVVGMYENGFCSLPANGERVEPIPRRVGVFLDLKEGDVSFYNMTDGSHLFSFPLSSSSGTLFPYFRLRSGNVSLTICSGMGGPVQTLVPLNNPPCSSEEPVSLSGQGISSGCGVDGDVPGAESPLLPCATKPTFTEDCDLSNREFKIAARTEFNRIQENQAIQ